MGTQIFYMYKNIVLLVVAIALLASCGSKSKYAGFEKTEKGLYYKFYKHCTDSLKPKKGDVLITKMLIQYKADSTVVLYNSSQMPNMLVLRDTTYYDGDITEGINMMHVGDSACFILLVDSLRKFIKIPDFVKKGDVLYYDIKLVGVINKENYHQQMQILKK